MQKLCSAEGAEKFRFCDFVTEQARGEFADDVTSDGLLGGSLYGKLPVALESQQDFGEFFWSK